MFYSDDIIEEVRSGNDIVDVISEYVNLKRQGSSYVGLCPFHSEKSPSFSVSRGKQMFYCFGCGQGGNVITFLMKRENYSFPEALHVLADRIGKTLPEAEISEEARKKSNEKKRLLELHKEAAKFYYVQLRSDQGEQAMAYFKNRGLTDETLKKFGLGFSGKYGDGLVHYLKQKGYKDGILKESGLVQYDEKRGAYDKFWNRVIFPIMDANHKVIAFGGRVMGDAKPKYLNSPETKIFDKSRNLYGLNFARSTREKYFLVCEGYMDVIALHQAGFTNAVASLGTALTSQHASLIRRFVTQVYLTYDSDEAGIKAALRAVALMRQVGISTRIVNMEPYKDPDEFIKNLGAGAYRQRIEEAENGFLFEVRMLSGEYDLKKPEENTAFFKAAAEKILIFDEELERDNYIRAISELYQVDPAVFKKMVVSRGKLEGLAGKIVRPKPKSGMQEPGKEKKDGMKQSQKLFITWLIDKPELFPVLKQYITPSDFTEEIYADVAGQLYEQLEEGELNPARIISRFEEEEMQSQVGELFNTRLKELSSKSAEEKALKETILRVKENKMHALMEDSQNPAAMQEAFERRQELEKLRKLHISLG